MSKDKWKGVKNDGPKLPWEFKKRWLAKLRSGKLKQARGALCEVVKMSKKRGVPTYGYCCLGVAGLCLKSQEWEHYENTAITVGEPKRFRGEESLIGSTLGKTKVEVKVRDALFHYVRAEDIGAISVEEVLAGMNDDGWTFKQIADWIEANL